MAVKLAGFLVCFEVVEVGIGRLDDAVVELYRWDVRSDSEACMVFM